MESKPSWKVLKKTKTKFQQIAEDVGCDTAQLERLIGYRDQRIEKKSSIRPTQIA